MSQQTLAEDHTTASSADTGSSTGPSPHPPGSVRRWRRPSPVVLFVALLALAGIALIQAPSIATWYSQLEYSREIVGLNRDTGAGDVTTRAAELAAARSYNEGLTGAAVVAAGQRIPQAVSDTDGADYDGLLASDASGLMARIKIPKIDVDLPIYHGTSDDVLQQGVGHLEGTALPVGGPTTHTVLTGHRGLAKAELFNNLDQLTPGDTFTIEVWGEVLTYRVAETKVVQPDETESLYPVFGKDLATLITCTPLGINTHRILVTGERVTPTPQRDLDAAGAEPTIPGFPWWAVWSAAGVLGVAGYVTATCRVRGTAALKNSHAAHARV
ncbi:class C sortase [Leucobacter chromiireducens]|uniref:class C sortase n=1 Tax=Leucobacter chromiireducens TaxID=283877 RepID=UPI003075D052